MLYHLEIFRHLNQNWSKHGKISQFVFAAIKSSNFDYEDLDIEDLLCLASSTTNNDDDDDDVRDRVVIMSVK